MADTKKTTAKKTSDKPKGKRGPIGWIVTPEILELVEKYASQGLAEYQIAHMFGICTDTWFRHKKNNPDLYDALKKGKSSGIEKVTNALFERASKGESDTSIIFFLKNRCPQEWAKNFDKSQSAPVKFDLDTSLSFPEQCNQVNAAAARGEISMDVAQQFISNITNMLKIQEVTDIDDRLKEIENKQNVTTK